MPNISDLPADPGNPHFLRPLRHLGTAGSAPHRDGEQGLTPGAAVIEGPWFRSHPGSPPDPNEVGHSFADAASRFARSFEPVSVEADWNARPPTGKKHVDECGRLFVRCWFDLRTNMFKEWNPPNCGNSWSCRACAKGKARTLLLRARPRFETFTVYHTVIPGIAGRGDYDRVVSRLGRQRERLRADTFGVRRDDDTMHVFATHDLSSSRLGITFQALSCQDAQEVLREHALRLPGVIKATQFSRTGPWKVVYDREQAAKREREEQQAWGVDTKVFFTAPYGLMRKAEPLAIERFAKQRGYRCDPRAGLFLPPDNPYATEQEQDQDAREWVRLFTEALNELRHQARDERS